MNKKKPKDFDSSKLHMKLSKRDLDLKKSIGRQLRSSDLQRKRPRGRDSNGRKPSANALLRKNRKELDSSTRLNKSA